MSCYRGFQRPLSKGQNCIYKRITVQPAHLVEQGTVRYSEDKMKPAQPYAKGRDTENRSKGCE